jgi:hypothetical protein
MVILSLIPTVLKLAVQVGGSLVLSEAAYHVVKRVTKREDLANIAAYVVGFIPWIPNVAGAARAVVNAMKNAARHATNVVRPIAARLPELGMAFRNALLAGYRAVTNGVRFVGPKVLGVLGKIGAAARQVAAKLVGRFRGVIGRVEQRVVGSKVINVTQKAAAASFAASTNAAAFVGAKMQSVMQRLADALKAGVKSAGVVVRKAARILALPAIAVGGALIGGAALFHALKNRGSNKRVDHSAAAKVEDVQRALQARVQQQRVVPPAVTAVVQDAARPVEEPLPLVPALVPTPVPAPAPVPAPVPAPAPDAAPPAPAMMPLVTAVMGMISPVVALMFMAYMFKTLLPTLKGLAR